VPGAGPDQETCQHQVGREPRLEGAENGVQPSKADPEIGDPDLELERARPPPDRLRHSCWKDNVAERSPQPHQSDRKDEGVSQQTIEDETTRQGSRAAGDCDRCAGECGYPRQYRDDRDHWPHIATWHLAAQERGT
jgi:hypothetical protein